MQQLLMSETINNFLTAASSNTLDTLLAQNEVFNQETGNWKYQGTVLSGDYKGMSVSAKVTVFYTAGS